MAGWSWLGSWVFSVDLVVAGGRPALWLTSCFDLLIWVWSTMSSAGWSWECDFGEI